MSQYELVFSGQLVEGFALDQVKANVAKLFKASPAQVEQMFSGKAVVLRNRLDDATARKYQAILQKNGALCQLRPMGGAAPPSPEPAAERQAPATPTAPSTTERPAPAEAPAPAAVAKKGTGGVTSPPGALPVAGEKVDEILSDVDWDVAPAGSQLADEHHDLPAVEPDISHLSMAPAGSDLGQKKAAPPPPAPDTSHLKLED